ncbi:MAG: SgcJ/EcaC family oxidoreductase, partial [Caulobacteraceae bacterium]
GVSGLVLAGLVMAAALTGAFPALAADPRAADEAAIRALVQRMQDGWNRGDFRAYMAGFANPGVVFVSNGVIQKDWQGTLDHYVRDYGAPGRRGVVSFQVGKIDLLAPDAAVFVAHYHMARKDQPMEGVFTDVARKIDGRWIITLNHVSAHRAKS